MTDLLVENDNDIELDIEGASVSMNAKWGDITGNINEQTDLMAIIDGKADEDEVVKLTGNQTIEGKKTFNEPVHLINDNGTIPLLVVHDGLDNKTGLGQYGFNLDYETENEKVLAFPTLEENDTIATQRQLNSKADDNKVVKLEGNQEIEGIKTFKNEPIFLNSISIDNNANTGKYVQMTPSRIYYFWKETVKDWNTYINFPNLNYADKVTLVTDIDLESKEDKSNKVVSLSAQSTDTQYPSAKCVYDLIGDVESLLEAI